jgi:hypothetical protein
LQQQLGVRFDEPVQVWIVPVATQVRISKLEGDSLTLSTGGPVSTRGFVATPIVEWRRARRNH